MYNQLFDWFIWEIKPTSDTVIIWIDEWNMKSIMRVPCDEMWYPKYKQINTMSMQRKHLNAYASVDDPIEMVSVLKKEIYIENPLVLFAHTHRVLIWKAKLWGEDMESLENVDIKTLQKMVTDTIDKQDCIILENVSDLVESIKNLQGEI